MEVLLKFQSSVNSVILILTSFNSKLNNVKGYATCSHNTLNKTRNVNMQIWMVIHDV